MKTSKYVDENGIEIEYILQKANNPSKALVVAFPGPAGRMRGGEWGYLVTIKKVADINALFLKTNPEYSKSRLTFRGGEPVIDEAIFGLVNQVRGELGIEQIIAVGTSMGGYSALYFGLKYDWDIISGSPSYTFSASSDESILYSMGSKEADKRDFMNNLLASMIKIAGDKNYNKKCFISWGEGERIWKKQSEGPQMLKDMQECKVPHIYALYPFSDHLTCAELFPQTLEKYLKYYLGLGEKPSEDENVALPPKSKMFKGLADAYAGISDIIGNLKDAKPNLDIKDNVIYGYNNDEIALRNFAYIKEGWLWGVGERYRWPGGEDVSKPVKIKSYWDPVNIRDDKTILSFYFQSTLLRWYKRQKNESVLKWLLKNAVEYMQSLPKLPKYGFDYAHIKPFDHMIRMLYFIELHRLSSGHIAGDVDAVFSSEIRRSLKYMAEQGANPMPIRWQYRMVLGLLIVAMYYRDSEAYEVIYSAAIDIFNELIDYHFDKNGCCITGNMDSLDFSVGELKNVMDFILENDMEKLKKFQQAKRKYNKILEFAAHICQPDNRLPALGSTGANQRCISRQMVKHISGCFMPRNSNLCILEDEKSLSYITINGGSNVNSTTRHCDLLSFTWNYGKVQVFHDAGSLGRNSPFIDYVSSSVAHNGFVCDNLNYMTPDYSDWTAIDEDIDEREDCVIIPTSHTLIDGVTLKRKFFWLKPNILILIDEGTADKERNYVQNFLLGNFGLDKKDLSKISLSVSSDIEGCIMQHLGSEDIQLEEYRGVNELGDDINPRGTIIENWRIPRRGLNLAYSKNGKEARFVTSIELHSKKMAADEQSLQSVNFDADGNLIVVLGDGKIIYEKMPEKQ